MLFKKILVPLDGSKLAECALPYAEELALSSKSENLTLVSVTERIEGKISSPESLEVYESSQRSGVTEISGGPVTRYVMPASGGAIPEIRATENKRAVSITFGKLESQADKYLHKIADKLGEKGIPVAIEVLMGNVAEEITRYAEANNFDVIVMSSHGRTGPSRWALGSVSEKVFRASCIPVFLVRAPGCFPRV